jgi:hypothetical protein
VQGPAGREYLEKSYGGWVGNAPKIMLEPDGRVRHILYGFSGPMLIARDDLLAQAGLKPPPATGSTCSRTRRGPTSPRRRSGSAFP